MSGLTSSVESAGLSIASRNTGPRLRWRAAGPLALGAACLFSLRTAHADTGAGLVRLSYAADPGCPNREAFFSQVRARAPRVEIVEDDTALRDLTVTLRAGPEGSTGRLEKHVDDGTVTIREVQGRSCEAVASAQALATALALDESSVSHADEDTAPFEAAEPTPAPSAAPPVPSESPITGGAAPDEPGPGVRWGFGATAGFIGAVLPGLSADVSAFVDATRPSRTMPISVRLYVARIFPRNRGYEWGQASADATSGGLQMCPLRWSVPRAGANLRPCLGIDLGSLGTAGILTENGGQAATDRRFWSTGTLGVRVEWALNTTWQVELYGGAVFPFTRYSYTLANLSPTAPTADTVVYRVPVVTGSASLGAAMHFR